MTHIWLDKSCPLDRVDVAGVGLSKTATAVDPRAAAKVRKSAQGKFLVHGTGPKAGAAWLASAPAEGSLPLGAYLRTGEPGALLDEVGRLRVELGQAKERHAEELRQRDELVGTLRARIAELTSEPASTDAEEA